MPTLSSLANIPGYGAYVAKREMNDQQGMQDLQQASALLQLRNAIQGQQQEQQLKQGLADSAGDVEAAMNAAIRSGNLAAAAKLAPLVEARRKQTQPRVLSPGSQLLGDNNEVLHTAPFKPDAAPAPSPLTRMIQERDALPAGSQERATYDAAIKKATEGLPKPERQTFPIVHAGDGIYERRPEGLVRLMGPDGKPLQPTAREKPINEFQGKNFLYGSRAQMADQTLLDLEEKISVVGLSTKQAVQNFPLVGGMLGAVGNKALSKEQQKVEQAQRNFVNAVLRQESGAVISDQEFENAKKQYFPQPGDTKEVIAQKRANRQVAIAGFKKLAGPAWEERGASDAGGWGIREIK